MEYSAIHQLLNSKAMKLDVRCSKCKKMLNGWEDYCPHCGKKLKHIIKEVKIDDVMSVLNANISKLSEWSISDKIAAA